MTDRDALAALIETAIDDTPGARTYAVRVGHAECLIAADAILAAGWQAPGSAPPRIYVWSTSTSLPGTKEEGQGRYLPAGSPVPRVGEWYRHLRVKEVRHNDHRIVVVCE
jgi:hypothetical protein